MRKIIRTSTLNSKFWRITAVMCTIAACLFAAGCSNPSGDDTAYNNYTGGIVTQSDADLTALTIAEGSPSSAVVTDPPFAYHVTDYTLWVTENYSSVTFNATARGATAAISATTYENDGVTDIGGSTTALTSGVDGAIVLSLDGTPGDEANELANIIKVTVTEGTDSKVYRFKVRPRYTSTNYAFDGDIDTLMGVLLTSRWEMISSPISVVGVITSKDIYASKAGEKSFIIQDSQLGVMIGSDESLDFPLGAKVRVTINNVEGREYYDQAQVKGFEAIELISMNNTIPYRTGTTGRDFMDAELEDNGVSDATSGWVSLVYKYTVNTADGVLVEPDRYSSGQFDMIHLHNHFVYGDQGHAYSINRGMEAYVQPGTKGDYFGPVISSFGYSMHLALPTQVRVFE